MQTLYLFLNIVTLRFLGCCGQKMTQLDHLSIGLRSKDEKKHHARDAEVHEYDVHKTMSFDHLTIGMSRNGDEESSEDLLREQTPIHFERNKYCYECIINDPATTELMYRYFIEQSLQELNTQNPEQYMVFDVDHDIRAVMRGTTFYGIFKATRVTYECASRPQSCTKYDCYSEVLYKPWNGDSRVLCIQCDL